MATTLAAATTAAPAQTARVRLDSIDCLRGLVMVIMALDHVRDYYTSARIDPMDIAHTWPALYFTRWITHFCAPVFVFLSGTAAYLYGARGRTTAELSRFLWTRGVWLVILEFTVLRLCWGFSWDSSVFFGIVIFAIGCCLILLAAAVYLPVRVVGAIGIALMALHNAFDWVQPGKLGVFGPLWNFFFASGPVPLGGGRTLFVAYAVLPWFGVMAAGYAFGLFFTQRSSGRRPALLKLGGALTVAFVLIRALNIYGDPSRWVPQNSLMRTVMSFLNCNKYPPSLDYLLMTLGPAIMLLALLPDRAGTLAKPFVVFGRVPMFYYLVHIPLLHLGAAILAVRQFGHAPWMFKFIPNTLPGTEPPPGWGYSLPVVYAVWIGLVLLLYPFCAWFARLKQRRRDAWLSYI